MPLRPALLQYCSIFRQGGILQTVFCSCQSLLERLAVLRKIRGALREIGGGLLRWKQACCSWISPEPFKDSIAEVVDTAPKRILAIGSREILERFLQHSEIGEHHRPLAERSRISGANSQAFGPIADRLLVTSQSVVNSARLR